MEEQLVLFLGRDVHVAGGVDAALAVCLTVVARQEPERGAVAGPVLIARACLLSR